MNLMHFTQSPAWKEQQRRKNLSQAERRAEDKQFFQQYLNMLTEFEKPRKSREESKRKLMLN